MLIACRLAFFKEHNRARNRGVKVRGQFRAYATAYMHLFLRLFGLSHSPGHPGNAGMPTRCVIIKPNLILLSGLGRVFSSASCGLSHRLVHLHRSDNNSCSSSHDARPIKLAPNLK
jgi:hypothetical protein